MLTRGDLLGDRYRLDERIASGGMGEVWKATDTALGRTVALKVLREALLAAPGLNARLRTEARTMAALDHPNVVNIYDFGHSPVPDGTAPYLVMAHVDGQSLAARIAALGSLPVGETLAVLAQAADALHAAHARGIVHRDVKPANLLVRPDGTVVLVDFGVAQSPDATSVTTAGQVVGTALYMAPEQATGRSLSPATDIYALGAVGYHCLTGRPPFPGDSPVQVAMRHLSEQPAPLPPSVPPVVRALIMRALRKDPADRFPDAAAFAASARAARMTAAPGEPRRAWRLPALVSLSVLLLLLGIAGLAILMGGADSRGGSAPADRRVLHQPATPVTSQQPTIREPGRSVATIVRNGPGTPAAGVTSPPAAPLPVPTSAHTGGTTPSAPPPSATPSTSGTGETGSPAPSISPTPG